MFQLKDSFRAWTVVSAAFVGLLFSVGVLFVYSFGVLGSAIGTEYGWGNVERSTLFVAFSLSSAVAGPIWGAIADKIGSRQVVLVSTVLLAVGFALISVVPGNLVLIHLAFAFVGLVGSGTLPPAYASVVVDWFDRHRGLALGLSMLGVGVGAAVLPVIAAAITTHYGWRATCLAYAGMALFLSLPTAGLLLRSFPAVEGRANMGRKAAPVPLRSILREGRMRTLMLFAFLTGAVLLSCVTNFVPILQSRGETMVDAARYQSVLGLSLIVGRILTGALLDRVFAPSVMALVLIVTGIGIIVLQSGSSLSAYAIAAMGIGLAIGAEVDFLGFMVSKYFPRESFTTLFALLFAIYSVGASAGPLAFGWLVQRIGTSGPPLIGMAILIFGLAAVMLTLPRYRRMDC